MSYRDEEPRHLPLHIILIAVTMVTLYPIFWVFSIVFSGKQSLAIADLPADPTTWDRVRAILPSTGLQLTSSPENRRLEWTFEPTVSLSIRVRSIAGPKLPVSELEVLRFMPSHKDDWPNRLTQKKGLQQEMLAGAGDLTYTITLAGDTQDAYTQISQQPWVSGIRSSRNDGQVTWQVSVTDEAAAEEQLSSLLVSNGLKVFNFGRKEQNLEDVFINIVERSQK